MDRLVLLRPTVAALRKSQRDRVPTILTKRRRSTGQDGWKRAIIARISGPAKLIIPTQRLAGGHGASSKFSQMLISHKNIGREIYGQTRAQIPGLSQDSDSSPSRGRRRPTPGRARANSKVRRTPLPLTPQRTITEVPTARRTRPLPSSGHHRQQIFRTPTPARRLFEGVRKDNGEFSLSPTPPPLEKDKKEKARNI